MAFKLNLTHNTQIICSAWKQRFFSLFMKVEVCTNVLRAESVSNTYYHKLSLKYWKLAAMQLSDLPSPVYKPSKEAHWCRHFMLSTGLCHFVLGEVLVWRLERRLCLFVCTLICVRVRDNSTSPSYQARELKSDVWIQIFEVRASETWGSGGRRGGYSQNWSFNPFIRSHPLFLVDFSHNLFC